MENIALTTLVVFILAMPGYVARSAYHSGNLTGAVLRRSIMNDLVWTIMIAMPIHAIGVFIVEHLHELWDLIPDINFEATFRLLTGEYGPESVLLTDLIGNVYQNSHYITAYVLFLLLLSLGLGLWLRKLVWELQLDLRFPHIFGFGNLWLYRLTGRNRLAATPRGEEVIPVVDALVDLGEKTRLYRGVVWDFTTDETGALQDILLIQALRGKFGEDTGKEEEFYWQEIPGDIFVLKYSNVLNLNITYLPLADQSSQT